MPNFTDLLPNVSAPSQITPCKLLLFLGTWTTKAVNYIKLWCEQAAPVSRACLNALRALAYWPNTTVRNQTSVFTEGIGSQEASLHGPLWSLMYCWSEPTHSEMRPLSLSSCFLTSHCLNPLPLPPSSTSFLSFLSLPLLLHSPLSPSCLSLSMTFFSSSSSAFSFFPPQSHSFNSQEHLHCNTLAFSHALRGGVQLVHYVSRVFLTLMENTQNALAFHHSTGKGETLSPTYCLRKGKFPPTSCSSQ